MIKAYLTAFPIAYEGEDIEVRYRLFQDDVPMKRKSVFLEYMKPAVVGPMSVLTLLAELENDKEKEIQIFINDEALYEIIKGSSTTKNGDVLKMASKLKKQMSKFEKLSFVNVTKNKNAFTTWKEMLED